MEGLQASIMKLTLLKGGKGEDSRAELISQLEATRTKSADDERLVRKAAWMAESREEVLKRQEFEGRTMMAEVIPELAWKLMLDKLGSKDKALMSRMCLLWRDLVKMDRTTFLFQAVFPLLHPYLSREEITNFRGVCAEWKKFLDSHLQNQLVYHHHPSTKLDLDAELDPLPDNLTLRFDGDWHPVSQFLSWATEAYHPLSEKNPFISRKLLVEYPYNLEDSPNAYFRVLFWNSVQDLLQECGRHLWEAEFALDETTNVLDAKNQLRILSSLMPNLRYLTVDGELLGSECKVKLPPSTSKSLKKLMRKTPFSNLPHLQTLILKWVPSLIASELVKKSSSTLETILLFEFLGSPNACIGSISLPKLKRFFYGAKYTPESFAAPLFSASAWPCLEELNLMFFNLDGADVPKLFQYLNALEEESAAGLGLRRLTLWLHNIFGPLQKLDEATLKRLELKLARLEEFSMTICRINLKTIDFILPMTSLKKLTVVYEKHVSSFGKAKKGGDKDKAGPSKAIASSSADVPSGEIIQFGNYTNRLYESNIWRLLPELKIITIGTITKLKKKGVELTNEGGGEVKNIMKEKVYTREGYQEFWKRDVDVAAPSSPSSIH